MQRNEFNQDKNSYARVKNLVQPRREKWIENFRHHHFSVEGINRPEQHSNIDSKWKSESRENVIFKLSYQRAVHQTNFVWSIEVVDEWDRKVWRLNDLQRGNLLIKEFHLKIFSCFLPHWEPWDKRTFHQTYIVAEQSLQVKHKHNRNKSHICNAQRQKDGKSWEENFSRMTFSYFVCISRRSRMRLIGNSSFQMN